MCQVPDLTNWKLMALPKNKGLPADMTDLHWKFSKAGEKWVIVQNEYNYDRGDSLPIKHDYVQKNLLNDKWFRFAKKIPGGYLVGQENFNGLFFIADDGISGYIIDGHLNVPYIFEYNGKYLALEGYAQRNYEPRGQILEIYKKRNLWKSRTVIEMKDAPELIVDYKDEKVVLTCSSILKFGKDIKPKEILKTPFFMGTLAPYSLLINNSDLFIAMAGGVLKIKTFDSKPIYEWYIPK